VDAVNEEASKAMNQVRVIIVDDHAIWRGGLRSLLSGTEFTIVAEGVDGQDALPLVQEHNADLLLMDIRMQNTDGLVALTQVKAMFPKLPVILLTTYENPTFVARALSGGAAGYLLKGVERDDLLATMRAVLAGDSTLNRDDFLRALRSTGPMTGAQMDIPEPLTIREEEVLRLVTTGLSNKEIAALLFISDGTVKSHVEHILRKLGVSDRAQAAVWAVRNGLVE
jgi:DNA-binding NarL/FixJ family response regulator